MKKCPKPQRVSMFSRSEAQKKDDERRALYISIKQKIHKNTNELIDNCQNDSKRDSKKEARRMSMHSQMSSTRQNNQLQEMTVMMRDQQYFNQDLQLQLESLRRINKINEKVIDDLQRQIQEINIKNKELRKYKEGFDIFEEKHPGQDV